MKLNIQYRKPYIKQHLMEVLLYLYISSILVNSLKSGVSFTFLKYMETSVK